MKKMRRRKVHRVNTRPGTSCATIYTKRTRAYADKDEHFSAAFRWLVRVSPDGIQFSF